MRNLNSKEIQAVSGAINPLVAGCIGYAAGNIATNIFGEKAAIPTIVMFHTVGCMAIVSVSFAIAVLLE